MENNIAMKPFSGSLKRRIKMIREEDPAAKDRTTGFQVAATAILMTAIFCIIWYLTKVLS